MTVVVPDLGAAAGRAILAGRQSWDRDGRIYASDAGVALKGGKCKRAFWGELRNEPKAPTSVGSALMFQQGDNLHDLFTDYLKQELGAEGWEVVLVETRVPVAPDIGSRLDCAIRHKDSGAIIVIDFKTKRGSAFKFLDGPKADNVLQVQQYIEGLKNYLLQDDGQLELLSGDGIDGDPCTWKAEDVVGGLLLYIDREGSNFVKQFPEPGEEPIQPDPEKVKWALDIARAIRDSDEPPDLLPPQVSIEARKGNDAIYLVKPWQMDWCSLKTCHCAKALPKGFPSKKLLVGHVHEAEGTKKIVMKEEFSNWGPLVMGLLNGGDSE